VAKKHNKSRKQKPNYSKRGMGNLRVEAGTDLELGEKNKETEKTDLCSRPPTPRGK